MSKPCHVYWYHLKEHTDPTTQGYIGVTVDLTVRDNNHRLHKLRRSSHLRNAINKYGTANVVRDVLYTTSIANAYAIEESLRPASYTGWNIAKGGGLPPDCTGNKHTEQTKFKIGLAHRGRIGKPSKFKGMTNRHSNETKALIGSYHKGKIITEAHKERCRIACTGSKSVLAEQVFMVLKTEPDVVYIFGSLGEAANVAKIGYSALRSCYQSANKNGFATGIQGHSAYIVIPEIHKDTPSIAIKLAREHYKKAITFTPRKSGKDNWKSVPITYEHRDGTIKCYESILSSLKDVSMTDATIRYHLAKCNANKRDSNYMRSNWKVKYVEVQE